MGRSHPPAGPNDTVMASQLILSLALAVFASCMHTIGKPAKPMASGDWPYYGSDAASTKFSVLDQIDSTNVDELRMIWSWR